MNTTNAIFKHLGQNFLCDNKEDLGIWKINSWALSRLYNNTKLRQIQKKKTKKKLVHIFTVKEHSVHSEQHSFKEKGNDKDKCISLWGSGSAVIRRGSRGLVQVEMTTEQTRAALSDQDATQRTKFFLNRWRSQRGGCGVIVAETRLWNVVGQTEQCYIHVHMNAGGRWSPQSKNASQKAGTNEELNRRRSSRCWSPSV